MCYEHTYISIHIHILITCVYFTILTHVKFLHELSAVYQYMYLF